MLESLTGFVVCVFLLFFNFFHLVIISFRNLSLF